MTMKIKVHEADNGLPKGASRNFKNYLDQLQRFLDNNAGMGLTIVKSNLDKDGAHITIEQINPDTGTNPEDGIESWMSEDDFQKTEAFGSVDDMLTKEQQNIVLKAYKDALDEVLMYVKTALPEGYTPTQMVFGNPFYTSIGTENPNLDRYDPYRFGPHLFNVSVDFIDNSLNGGSSKVAFRVDVVDAKTGETTIQKKLVYIDPFVEEFLDMKKSAFLIRLTDADKIADAVDKAFKH